MAKIYKKSHIVTPKAIPEDTAPALASDPEKIAQAYAQGLEEGLRQAQSAHQQHEAAQGILYDRIIKTLETHYTQSKTDVIEAILLITKTLLMEKHMHQEHIIEHVERTLQKIHHKKNLTLYLHPYDMAIFLKHSENNPLPWNQDIHIMPDPALDLGGCTVHTTYGNFNASTETHLEQIKSMILQLRGLSL